MFEVKVCVICGKEFEAMHSRMRYCTPSCRYKAQWRQRKTDKAAVNKSANIKPTKYSPKPKPVFITDEEQRAIDKALFIKTAVHFDSKCYKPGDPEWEKLCQSITPLDKIPKHRYTGNERSQAIIPSRQPLGGMN